MTASSPSPFAFLNVPGEMAALMREKDWSQTPFGPVETWSTALRSAVSICLGSRFPIVLYWGPTRALIYNDAWAPVPGQKHPWALGRPGPEVWSEIWDIIGPMFDHVMDTGEATWSEDQLLPLNRFGYVEECYFYYSYSPVRGEDGSVEGIFTAVTETTYRVLAERRERLLREIAEAASRLNTAEEATQAAVRQLATMREEAPFALAYLRDAQTGALRRVACENLCDGDELAPLGIAPDRDPTPWRFAEVLRQGTSVTIGNLARFGRQLPSAPWPEQVEQAVVTPILSPRPEAPYGFVVAAASARRRVDKDYVTLFERAAAHIATAISNAEAYAEERRRAERLAELDRAKTAFFSNASHEFRTPLTLMLGPVEDMLDRGDATAAAIPVDRGELALVQRNGQRLLRLVNTLLDFSRIEAGRVRARFEPVDLAGFTAELASTFRSAMERAGLAYAIDCPPLPENVWVDREMWEKIVLNLVSNAFKYTLRGGVAVSLSAEEGQASLEVRDTGVGIPAAELGRVFERFHRIEGQEGRTHEGTGIGLALVKDLTQLHGGEVSVESRAGEGSAFRVRVPFGRHEFAADAAADGRPQGQSTATRARTFLAEAERWLPDGDAQAQQDAPALGEGTPAQAVRTKGASVLVADDNADMRGYVTRLLSHAGYRVEEVADGRAAVERARAETPDLLLSDVMMPRLDGFGVLAELRNAPETADLPIILLSARAGEEAAIEGLEAGADDYLVKPFSARELIARVEGALRMAQLRGETAQALRASNEELEERVEQRTRERDRSWTVSHDLIGIANSAGVWQAVNPAWTRVLGWKTDEIVGRTSEWMEHPEDRARTREAVGSLAAGATTFDFVNRFRTRSGDYRTLSWTAVPEEGLLYCVARDVTEERKFERRQKLLFDLLVQQRAAADERLVMRAAAAALGEYLSVDRAGFFELSDDDTAVFIESWTGGSSPPLTGEFPVAGLGAALEDVRRGEALVSSDTRGDPHMAGSVFPTIGTLSAIGVPLLRDGRWHAGLYVNHGQVRRWAPDDVAIAREIAELTWDAVERLRAQKGLREANATLESRVAAARADLEAVNASLESRVEQRTAELQAAEEALRQSQKMEAVGQLTGGIAHDFNNLLTGVTGSLELLQIRVKQGRLDAVDRYVTAAQGAARRAAALTQRLLAFSRRQTLDPKPTNVNRMVAEMEELIRRSVGPAIAIEVVGAAGLWPVQVDANQLENALLNLCINARDAMPDGGRLTIETANKWLDDRAARERDLPPGQYVSLCVTDTGTGMAPDVIARAFDPFFTTKPIGQGTGLGLSMIYGFVRQSGGQVRIYSEVDKGTTMCLYLPRFHGEAENAEGFSNGTEAARGNGRTVLVVDDEPTVRMLVSEVLEDAGFAVLEASDGPAGLLILQSKARLDLLITDVGLPGGMNGRQIADAARAMRPGLNVLFITGYAENAAVGNGHLEPGMRLLTKPFTVEDLGNKVREILEGTA